MHRGEHILAYDTLVQHDGILVVVTLPRHVGNQQVAAQCQLTILSGITLGQDVTSLHALSFLADRTQVDGHVLVGAAELRNAILFQGGLEAYELLILSTVVENADGGSVHILDDTIALGGNHGT